jgi:hypothetical protein
MKLGPIFFSAWCTSIVALSMGLAGTYTPSLLNALLIVITFIESMKAFPNSEP